MIKKYLNLEDLMQFIGMSVLLGLISVFNFGMGKLVLFLNASYYVELGKYNTAFYYLRLLINNFAFAFCFFSLIFFLMLLVIHFLMTAFAKDRVEGRKYSYYIIIGILFGLVLITYYHLHKSPWYDRFYSRHGLFYDAILFLFFVFLGFTLSKRFAGIIYLLLGILLVLLVFITNGYFDYQKSRIPVIFTNVAEGVGLKEVNNSFGVAWGDYNNDGWIDAFVSNHLDETAESYLYQNEGGVFSPAKPMAAGDLHGVAWGDFDNDGALDLFVAGGNSGPGPDFPNMLFYNDNGEFKNIASGAGIEDTQARGRGGAWADFNNDGLLDLFVANYFTSNALFLNNSDETFTNVAKISGIVETEPGEANEVGTLCASWADYDSDGDMDLLTVALIKGISLYRNNGDGTFTDIAANAGLITENSLGKRDESTGLSGCAWADYDNDRDLDLYITSFLGPSGRNLLFQNLGSGTFIEVAAQAGVDTRSFSRAAVWGDLNNDGHIDLYVVNQASDRKGEPHGDDPGGWNNLYINQGDGTFSDFAEAAGALGFPFVHEPTAALADYDNDGFLDIFIINERPSMEYPSYLKRFIKGYLFKIYLMKNILLRNSGGGNNWLKIRLQGTVSNRDGIGTKIFLFTGDQKQFREQNGGAHTFAQNSMVIHFGLNKGNVVDRLLVEWPSGITQTLTDVKVNQTLIITEPIPEYLGDKRGSE